MPKAFLEKKKKYVTPVSICYAKCISRYKAIKRSKMCNMKIRISKFTIYLL